MHLYRQSDGLVIDLQGIAEGLGYSGAGQGKNNPEMQDIHNVGPIPRGLYQIQQPQNTVTHGPYVLPLIPDPQNEMFGRYGFLIHGDSVVEPGTASQGCIILPRDLREKIWNSGDHQIRVVSGYWNPPDDEPHHKENTKC